MPPRPYLQTNKNYSLTVAIKFKNMSIKNEPNKPRVNTNKIDPKISKILGFTYTSKYQGRNNLNSQKYYAEQIIF